MALLSSADAIAALIAAGWTAYKSPARAHGRCQTLCYVVGGQPVNLGRLRQLAREVMGPAAATAEPVVSAEPPAAEPVVSAEPPARRNSWADPAAVVAHLCRRYPVSTAETYAPAVARLQARGAVVDPLTVLRELHRGAAEPVAPAAPAAPEPVAPVPAYPWDPGTPAAKPAAAKPAALLALESLAAGGPLDCATWQALGWPFEGFLAWAQRPNADAMVERLRATIRERGAAACLDSL
jgi:hypothetical protein